MVSCSSRIAMPRRPASGPGVLEPSARLAASATSSCARAERISRLAPLATAKFFFAARRSTSARERARSAYSNARGRAPSATSSAINRAYASCLSPAYPILLAAVLIDER